jgi:uncharacterized membrane protein YbhN (UPF0104 family)
MLYCQQMKKHLRTLLAVVILAITAAAFFRYIQQHPETLQRLTSLSPLVVIALLGLCSVTFFSYMLITRVCLRIYHKTMPMQEQFLFNSYSSLINFFGPGQSGPIFRGAYLKKRHNLGVKQFAFTVLLYLAFFAVISAMLVVVGSRPWWQTVLLMLAVGSVSWLIIRHYKKKSHIDTHGGLNLVNLSLFFVLVVAQVLLLAVTYGVELTAVDADASLGQILSYTGVSNFSLFVALTPGAIGIREAFLVFSQDLHHISSDTIVAANIIDRGV